MTWSQKTLEQNEKDHILATFAHFQGVKTSTANALDCAVRTLDAKLERYALDEKKEKDAYAESKRQREEFLRRSRGNPAAQYDTAAGPQPGGDPIPEAPEGLCVEPSSEPSEEPAVPVSERGEVQELLPENPSPRGKRSGR